MPAIGIIGSVIGGIAAALVLWRQFGPSTYLRFPTMFGRARVYQVEADDGSPVRLLEVGGIVQSGTYVDERYAELVFEYLKRYDLMFQAGRSVRHVAVLGCGGYDYPEHLIAHHPEVQVDAVEIDPAITAIARQYFFLDRAIEEFDTDADDEKPSRTNGGKDPDVTSRLRDDDETQLCEMPADPSAEGTVPFGCERPHRLKLICADALDHLKSTDARYDAIVNDCFDAGSPPAHLTGREFAQAAHDCLTPGGLYLTNVVSPLEGPRAAFLHAQVALLDSIFKHVGVFPCDPDSLTEPDNVIVAASDEPLPESSQFNLESPVQRQGA